MNEGIVNILKPPGMTSSNVVSEIRHIFGTRRVGHTGTLDPGAAGVLPVCIGRATRLFDFLVDKDKEYIAELAFGTATDTQDSYGRVTRRGTACVTEADVASAIPRFIGTVNQIAPMYSAVHVDGKKLYELARAGARPVEISRKAEIKDIALLARTGEGRFLIKIVCSKGTYVRTLCADIGEALGTCAHMSFLLRTRSGNFDVAGSYSIAELAGLKADGRLEEAVVPMEDALTMLPSVDMTVSDKDYRFLINGADVEAEAFSGFEKNALIKVRANGVFVGICEYNGKTVRMKVNLMPTEDNAR